MSLFVIATHQNIASEEVHSSKREFTFVQTDDLDLQKQSKYLKKTTLRNKLKKSKPHTPKKSKFTEIEVTAKEINVPTSKPRISRINELQNALKYFTNTEMNFLNRIINKCIISLKKESKESQFKTQKLKMHSASNSPSGNNSLNNSTDKKTIMILNSKNKKLSNLLSKKRRVGILNSKICFDRLIMKFHNIEDSESEVDTYSYFDFIPRWYSLHPKSKIYHASKLIKEITILFCMIFFPLELIQVNQSKLVFIHILIELTLIMTYFISLLTGFIDPNRKNNNVNYNLTSIFNYIYDSQNAIWVLYEQLVIFFNYFTLKLISYFGSLNFDYLFQILIITKLMLFMNLNDWIQLNPIFSSINELMMSFKEKKKSKKNDKNKQVQVPLLVSLYKAYTVFRVVVYYTIFIHIAACLWIYIYQCSVSRNINLNWVTSIGIVDSDFFTLYIASFYYSLTTFVSVGYGDIHPYNRLEMVYAICFMFLGILFYSFLVSLISSMVVKDESKRAILLEKKKILDSIAKEHKISDDLFNKVSRVIDHSVSNDNNDKLNLIEDLPSNLKDSIQLSIHDKTINTLYFFKDSEIGFTLYTCSFLKMSVYDKHFRLLNVGQNVSEMFFVMKGSIMLTLSDDYESYVVSKISSKEHFLDNFIESTELQQSTFNLDTNSNFNEIASLSKESYLKLKEKYPDNIAAISKINEFRYSMVEQLRLAAVDYFSKYGTLKNFRSYSLEKINLEIIKELGIVDYLKVQTLKRPSSKIIFTSSTLKKKESGKIQGSPYKKPKFNLKTVFPALHSPVKKLSCKASPIKNSVKTIIKKSKTSTMNHKAYLPLKEYRQLPQSLSYLQEEKVLLFIDKKKSINMRRKNTRTDNGTISPSISFSFSKAFSEQTENLCFAQLSSYLHNNFQCHPSGRNEKYDSSEVFQFEVSIAKCSVCVEETGKPVHKNYSAKIQEKINYKLNGYFHSLKEENKQLGKVTKKICTPKKLIQIPETRNAFQVEVESKSQPKASNLLFVNELLVDSQCYLKYDSDQFKPMPKASNGNSQNLSISYHNLSDERASIVKQEIIIAKSLNISNFEREQNT